jgi:tubulin gamma
MFKKTVEQYDRLRKKGAFIENYKQEAMFENGLEEFDDARFVPLLSFPSISGC